MSEQLQPARRTSWWRALCALGAVATVLTTIQVWTYKDCLGQFFHFDDFWVLAAAARIRADSPRDLLRIFEPIHGFLLYRPLSTVLYFVTLRAAFGYDPVGYHATQIAFHVLSAVLVYGIADSLLLSRPLATATALVYVTAPGHAIAACWMALFTMTGTTCLYFLAVLLWVRLDSRWRVPLALLVFVAGLLASEHAISLPVALTAASLLLMKGSGWRRNARELAPFYGIGGLYIAAKAYYLRHGLATTFPDPRARAYVEAGYRVNLEPRTILDHIGRYCTFTVDLLYNRLQSDAAAVVLGACVLLAAAGMTAAVLTGRWDGRMVRVAAFGLDLFIIGLVPVLVLPAHVYSYYVGIAALGMALAIVSALHALPWCPRLAPWTAVALLLAVHVGDTAVSVRGSEEFRFFRSFSDAAAGWLYALRRHAESPGVQEVVLPETKLTDMVFNLGQAHQLFLCADYRLLTVPDVDAVEPKAGRLILSQPERAPRGSGGHAWGWLQPCRAEP